MQGAHKWLHRLRPCICRFRSYSTHKSCICSMISRRPTSIVPTVSRSALVPVASPAMCFTSGSGASSRSIFNDLCAVVRLFQPPCALRSRTPYLLGFAYGQPPFSGLATEQRLACWYFPRPSARRRCSVVCFPARKVRIANTLFECKHFLAFSLSIKQKKCPFANALNGQKKSPSEDGQLKYICGGS